MSWLIRPLLHANLREYRRDVAQAAFPVDSPAPRVAGTPTERILFVGDVAVMGYGVLRQGMTVCTRVAHAVAAQRQRGVLWDSIAASDLTIARAAGLLPDSLPGVDLLVVMAGVPDILLATTPATWATSLEHLIANTRADHPDVRVVIAGLPPLAEFRPVSARVYRMITARVDALNAASADVARNSEASRYMAFPHTEPGALKVLDQLSWAKLHKAWARELAPTLVQALNASPPAGGMCSTAGSGVSAGA